MKILIVLLIALCMPMVACAQTTHFADLTFGASSTPGATYNVYQAPGLCSANGTFVKVGNTATLTFHVANLAAKTPYSWIVKATDGTDEAAPTNCSDGTTLKDPVAPAGSLLVIVK